MDVFQRTVTGAERCFYGSVGGCVDGEKGLRDYALWGEFGPFFLYLEMAEQIGRMQGAVEYYKGVPSWILRTWKAEFLAIIDIAA